MSIYPSSRYALSVTLLLASVLAGCERFAPKTEPAFLKRGRDLAAGKDYARAILEFRNAARLAPRDAEPYYELGQAQLNTGDYRSALAAFQRCLELNPHHSGAQLKIAGMMTSSSQKEVLAKAASQLRDLLESSPDNAEASDALALVEWRLGNREEAVERLQKLLDQMPASLSSSVLLARMKLSQNDLKAAEEVLHKAADSAPQSSEAALALAEMYVVTGQIAQAEPQMQRALQLNPTNAEALLALAALQVAANNWDRAEETYRRISALPDKSYRSLHALFLFQRGKRDEAIAELRSVVRRDAGDRMARTRLIAAYLETGRAAEGRKLLSDALSANPKDSDALMQRAALELRAGDAGSAQKDLGQVLQYRPENADAHRAMARTLKAQGQWQGERGELIEAVRLNADLLAARLALVRNYINANNPRTALQVLAEAPASQRQLLPVVIERNWALLAAGDQAELRTSLETALAASRNPVLVLQKALVQISGGDYAGARSSAEEVLRSNGEDVRALRILAETYRAQKQPVKALECLAEAARTHPRSAPIQHMLGSWQLASGDLIGARDQFTAALRADAAFTPSAIALADIDRRENRIDAARARLKTVVARKPSDIGALLLLAEIEKHAGNSSAAIERYRAVLVIDSINLVALNNISTELAAANPDEALGYAQKALEVAPRNPAVQDTLGWIYFRKGIYNTATEYLKTAVATEPNPQRQYHLALCYLKSGQSRLGRELLQTAIEQDPNLPAKIPEWSR